MSGCGNKMRWRHGVASRVLRVLKQYDSDEFSNDNDEDNPCSVSNVVRHDKLEGVDGG